MSGVATVSDQSLPHPSLFKVAVIHGAADPTPLIKRSRMSCDVQKAYFLVRSGAAHLQLNCPQSACQRFTNPGEAEQIRPGICQHSLDTYRVWLTLGKCSPVLAKFGPKYAIPEQDRPDLVNFCRILAKSGLLAKLAQNRTHGPRLAKLAHEGSTIGPMLANVGPT